MQYYIDINRKKRNDAGSKAPADIVKICNVMGLRKLSMPIRPELRSSIMKKMWGLTVYNLFWIKNFVVVKSGSRILYQHPRYYGNRIADKYIRLMKKTKSIEFIALIHDLESLRDGISGSLSVNKAAADYADNEFLKNFDKIICHNKRMISYLISKGFPEEKLVDLEIFDYLCEIEDKGQDESDQSEQFEIVIAGNLSKGKSGYIYKLSNTIRCNLYGSNYSAEDATDNVIYHGSVDPDKLPGILEGHFGLVWDGNSTNTCSGNTGNYLRYNDPHKASLYLAAGLPVIVWKKAAIAEFIEKNKAGITIDDLDELRDVLKKTDLDEYKSMKKNAEKIGEKVRAGYFFKKAWDPHE